MKIKNTKKAIKASSRKVRKAIKADEEVVEDIDVEEGGDVDVSEEASDLLFEATDVAQLVAEVTGEDVQVEADEDIVIFDVGEEQFTVTAEGDEELLEASTQPAKNTNKKTVKASRSAKRAKARRARR